MYDHVSLYLTPARSCSLVGRVSLGRPSTVLGLGLPLLPLLRGPFSRDRLRALQLFLFLSARVLPAPFGRVLCSTLDPFGPHLLSLWCLWVVLLADTL